jgi:hypothetical protein
MTFEEAANAVPVPPSVAFLSVTGTAGNRLSLRDDAVEVPTFWHSLQLVLASVVV